MAVLGLRVIRGPGWPGGEEDGGEGHVGTVIQWREAEDEVRVLWDMGMEGTYSTGGEGKRHLRVFDSAQIGIQHEEAQCAGCDVSSFHGMMWRCGECASCDLCPLCYGEDKHDPRHRFLRIDTPGSEGQPVSKRKTGVRTRALGLFPGSRVTRGRDWQWKDQDGGQGSEGEVQGYEESPGFARNMVRVQWDGGESHVYRAAFKGKMDVTCVDEETGPSFYRDHLPVLDTEQLKKLSEALKPANKEENCRPAETKGKSLEAEHKRDTSPPDEIPTVSTDKAGLRQIPGGDSKEDPTIEGGADSKTDLDKGSLSSANRHEDSSDTSHVIESRARDAGTSDGKEIGKHEGFQIGDQVRVGEDADTVKRLNERVGWKEEMDQDGVPAQWQAIRATPHQSSPSQEDDSRSMRQNQRIIPISRPGSEVIGKVGQVLKIDADGDLLVMFRHQYYFFAPACCTPLHPASHSAKDSPQPSAAAEVRPGSGTKPSPVQEDPKPSTAEISNEQTNYHLYQFKKIREAVIQESTTSSLRTLSFGTSGFFAAIGEGDHSRVLQILAADKSLIEREYQKFTPLMYASRKGNMEIVQLLLTLGADVNHMVGPHRCCLGAALEGKHEDVVLLLLEKGADPFIVDQRKLNALHIAAASDLPRIIPALAERGVDVNARNKYRDVPLHIAIEQHSNEVVERLVNLPGIDLTIANGNDFPMIHHACSKGNARAVELLVQKDKTLVHSLLNNGQSPLHVAAEADYDECVRALVLMGDADVNMPESKLYTPLHLACIRCCFRAAEALLELGANLNSQESRGHTPLHLTIGGRRVNDIHSPEYEQENQVRVALGSLLISNGAIVDVLNFEGRGAFTYGQGAVREGVERFVKCNPQLVRRGIDVESSGKPINSSIPADKRQGQLKDALKGVGLPCGVCGADKSAVTLHPCQHKCVCLPCSDKVSKCPLCDEEVKDKEETGPDDETFDVNNCKQM